MKDTLCLLRDCYCLEREDKSKVQLEYLDTFYCLMDPDSCDYYVNSLDKINEKLRFDRVNRN
ncbi:hypothetical protein HOE04_03710 [archaeon]|jgi:hypothetical protein|nr:hypothetical protein [archaeon]